MNYSKSYRKNYIQLSDILHYLGILLEYIYIYILKSTKYIYFVNLTSIIQYLNIYIYLFEYFR